MFYSAQNIFEKLNLLTINFPENTKFQVSLDKPEALAKPDLHPRGLVAVGSWLLAGAGVPLARRELSRAPQPGPHGPSWFAAWVLDFQNNLSRSSTDFKDPSYPCFLTDLSKSI